LKPTKNQAKELEKLKKDKFSTIKHYNDYHKRSDYKK